MKQQDKQVSIGIEKPVDAVPSQNQNHIKDADAVKIAALNGALAAANREVTTPVQPARPVQSTQAVNGQQSAVSTSVNSQSMPQRQSTNLEQSTGNVQIPAQTQQQNVSRQAQSAQTSPQTQYIYDKNTDYSALIAKYVSQGNYGQAAVLEQQRNAKIDGEGLPYEKSSQYAAWLPGGANYTPGNYIQMTETTSQNHSDLSPLINQMYDAAERQATVSVNYETQNAADQLNRALQDAQPQYERAIAQQLLETKQAQDAQALRNQVNGDRGGIGSAQVDSIINTGMKNREAIAQQQRQLATDTARQLADLRAQGKYQEASLLLQNSQQRLAALYNEQVRLQQEESSKEEILANLGSQYMAAGLMPSEDMLAALGIDADTAQRYIDLLKAQTSQTVQPAGHSGNDGVTPDPITDMSQLGVAARNIILRHGKPYKNGDYKGTMKNGVLYPSDLVVDLVTAYREGNITAEEQEFIANAFGIDLNADYYFGSVFPNG